MSDEDDYNKFEDEVPYFNHSGGIPLRDWLDKMRGRMINEIGQEMPDPTVIAPPVGFQDQQSIFDHMYAMLKAARAQELAEMEEDDTSQEEFGPDSDYEEDEPFSPYEERQMRLSGLQLEAQKATVAGGDAPANPILEEGHPEHPIEQPPVSAEPKEKSAAPAAPARPAKAP